MRFKSYINERILRKIENNDLKKFVKNTKPWWDMCNKYNVKNHYLWRGHDYIINDIRYLDVRKNREPLTTCKEFHELADKNFKKIFGIKARSETLFCFSGEKSSHSYGSYSSIIIPIGKFNYIWSKIIDDFYGSIQYEDQYSAVCGEKIELEYEW
jgi:hypothetical protein